MDWITSPETWIALLTLTALEIVLGIDNIVFISILVGRLPEEEQERGRQIGLIMALGTRILLLLSLSWLIKLTAPIFHIGEHGVAGRDIILMVGGMFLLWKSTSEIHDKLEGETEVSSNKVKASFGAVITQIAILDIVFSLDSVITAIGMAEQLAIMIAAVIISVVVMLFASGKISSFVNGRPTLKILALSFLLLIGVSLFAEGLHFHIPKGYIYFAMAFSLFVETLNLTADKNRRQPLHLHEPHMDGPPEN
jgi:predicted tellurium resistance membrane protein TerC